MKVVIVSGSPVEIKACKGAFNHVEGVTFVNRKPPSRINKQSTDYKEVVREARKDLDLAEKQEPEADLYMGIENGLMSKSNNTFILLLRDHFLQVTCIDDVTCLDKELQKSVKQIGL